MKDTRPRFSAAARLAAAAKRQERSRLAAESFNEPVVFALRAPPPLQGYIWEIRKFGGVSMERSTQSYPSAADARCAGLDVLAARKDASGQNEGPGQHELVE